MSIMEKGLIHLYTGDGKGKTTAAAGLAVRAAGRGRRVVFAQFLKGRKTGEISSLEKLGVRVVRSEKDFGFIWNMNDEQKEAFGAEQARLFEEVQRAAAETPIDLLVLDESLGAMMAGRLGADTLREFLSQKPENLEIVLTGREAPDWLMEIADYITNMTKEKHPYDRGVQARESIEY